MSAEGIFFLKYKTLSHHFRQRFYEKNIFKTRKKKSKFQKKFHEKKIW
jgi:hypothetical protein